MTGGLLRVIWPTPEGAGVQSHVPARHQSWWPGPGHCFCSELSRSPLEGTPSPTMFSLGVFSGTLGVSSAHLSLGMLGFSSLHSRMTYHSEWPCLSQSFCRSETATSLIGPLSLDLLPAQECAWVWFGLCGLPWGHWLRLGPVD